jgi:hypothetical protein
MGTNGPYREPGVSLEKRESRAVYHTLMNTKLSRYTALYDYKPEELNLLMDSTSLPPRYMGAKIDKNLPGLHYYYIDMEMSPKLGVQLIIEVPPKNIFVTATIQSGEHPHMCEYGSRSDFADIFGTTTVDFLNGGNNSHFFFDDVGRLFHFRYIRIGVNIEDWISPYINPAIYVSFLYDQKNKS